MDSKDIKMIESLLESGKLNDWESKVYKDIYDRNPTVLSIKQRRMFERAYFKYIDGRKTQVIIEATAHASIEEFPDGWKIVDNEGNVYGKGLSKVDAANILDWFSPVLAGTIQKPSNNNNNNNNNNQEENRTSPF